MRLVTVITVRSFVDSFVIVLIGLTAFASYVSNRNDLAITAALLYAAYNVVLRIFAATYYRYDDLDSEISETWLRRLGFVDEEKYPGVLRFFSVRTWIGPDGSRSWLIDSSYAPASGEVASSMVPRSIAPRNRGEALELFARLGLPIPRIKQCSA